MGDHNIITNKRKGENNNAKSEIEKCDSTEVNTILKPVIIESSEENTVKDVSPAEQTNELDFSPKTTNNVEDSVLTNSVQEERVPKLMATNVSASVPVTTTQTPKRRPIRNTFFIEEETICDEVLSTKGVRTTRLPRRRDSVNVFPPGCMGVKPLEESSVTSPRRFLNQNECHVRDSGHIEATPTKKRANSALPKMRNPLTGEGYDDDDAAARTSTHGRRLDGNPLLGQGYDNADETEAKPRRVPPGGYCHKLW